MKILAIETSCDETAVSLVDAQGDFSDTAQFDVLGNALLSQADMHKEFGGVYPSLAKREHAKNLVPLTLQALREAGCYGERMEPVQPALLLELRELFSREPELFSAFAEFYSAVEPPAIDAVAVTSGPGLEPALWVGINFATALSRVWDVPLIPVNHMEGHVLAAMMRREESSKSETRNSKQARNSKSQIQNTGGDAIRYTISDVQLPVLALLISGGHTQLVLMQAWGEYKLIGETRDDAVGEAFDKTARMLNLPYPGGPEISKLAEQARAERLEADEPLPRPMLHDDNSDFSFSGLKTAVLYRVKDKNLTDDEKKKMARAFEDAATDVLLAKTKRAIEEHGAKTVVIGGGVAANKHIREVFSRKLTDVALHLPSADLTTDNALMIAAAGYLRHELGTTAELQKLRADGNLALS